MLVRGGEVVEVSTVDSRNADRQDELCGAENGSNDEARVASVFVGEKWLFD